MHRCDFQLAVDKGFRCKHVPEADARLCVFHLPKPSHLEKQELVSSNRIRAEQLEISFKSKLRDLMAQTEADANAVAYDFRGFQFPSFSFERKRFLKKAYFHQATFQDVDFSSAVCCQEVRFVSSNFKGEVVFAGAQFLADVNFAGAHFGHEADFRLANFHELTLFSWATFSETGDFHWATFNKEAIFEVVTVLKELRVIGHADQRCFEGACNFRFLRLSKDAAVTLERVNLEHATFLDTDLERFSLRDVNWHRTPSRLGRLMPRQSLSDEFNFPKEVNMTEADYEKVAENYRQLVLNYERKRDYDTAEDFHIGEMEMRRKKRGAHIQNKGLRKLREWTNSYGFYRALSNYGTSYVQAFLVLLAFLC